MWVVSEDVLRTSLAFRVTVSTLQGLTMIGQHLQIFLAERKEGNKTSHVSKACTNSAPDKQPFCSLSASLLILKPHHFPLIARRKVAHLLSLLLLLLFRHSAKSYNAQD